MMLIKGRHDDSEAFLLTPKVHNENEMIQESDQELKTGQRSQHCHIRLSISEMNTFFQGLERLNRTLECR